MTPGVKKASTRSNARLVFNPVPHLVHRGRVRDLVESRCDIAFHRPLAERDLVFHHLVVGTAGELARLGNWVGTYTRSNGLTDFVTR